MFKESNSFEGAESQIDPAGPSTAHPGSCQHGHPQSSDHLISPCACCSPVFAELVKHMAFDETDMADPKFWARKNRCKDQQVRNAILVNAKILTVDDSFSEVSAMAIKDGKIVSVGDERSVRENADDDAEIIDCGGNTILPGFIEPHMHFFPIASIGRLRIRAGHGGRAAPGGRAPSRRTTPPTLGA